MLKMLAALAEQKLGYSYGKPLRIDDKSLAVVLPILRETSLHRQYTTFPETDKVMVFDSGKIDVMDVENGTEENIFVRSGTLFRGSTQTRALQRSAVLFPHKKQTLSVRCVHQTHGISAKAKTTYGGIVPLAFDQMNYDAGYKPKDQQAYWSNAQKTTQHFMKATGKTPPAPKGGQNSMGLRRRSMMRSSEPEEGVNFMNTGGLDSSGLMYSSSDCAAGPIGAAGAAGPVGDQAFFSSANAFTGSDDLAKHFDDFSMHFDEVLSKVKLVENQAGLALINANGVETIEFFDHKLSWKALHESAVKRLGSNIVQQDSEQVFEYKPENAVKAVNRVLAMDWKTTPIFHHRPSNGEPDVEITGLSADGFVGEAVELNGSLIHLVLLRQK